MKRVFDIKRQVRKLTGQRKIHKTRMLKIIDIETSKNKSSLGEISIEKLDNLQQLVKSWRRHSIENKFSSEICSIDNE